jgi:RHS repeat-associated protein
MSQTTSKERDAETGLDYFLARYYSGAEGRFSSPDPLVIPKLGRRVFLAHLSDPQTWNKYAYVMNNPLTRTDPTGLDFYLTCKQTKDNGSTCQNGHVGTTDSKGNFTATVITSAQLQDAKSGIAGMVTEGGVKIKTATGTYGAQFINGTQSATLQGSGSLSPFTFNITGQSKGNQARGTWQFNGTPAQAAQWMNSHGSWTYPLDPFNPFHPGTEQHRFSDPNNSAGPSIHISQPLGVRIGIVDGFNTGLQTFPSASEGEFHVDNHGTIGGHIEDIWDTIMR